MKYWFTALLLMGTLGFTWAQVFDPTDPPSVYIMQQQSSIIQENYIKYSTISAGSASDSSSSTTLRYNDQGMLYEMSMRSARGEMKRLMVYQDDKNVQQVHYATNGRINDIYHLVYSDGNAWAALQLLRDEDGAATTAFELNLNDSAQLSRLVCYGLDLNYQISYDEEWAVVQTFDYDSNGRFKTKTVKANRENIIYHYLYNDLGQLVKIEQQFPYAEKRYSFIEYFYNSEGLLDKRIQYRNEGVEIEVFSYYK